MLVLFMHPHREVAVVRVSTMAQASLDYAHLIGHDLTFMLCRKTDGCIT